MKRLLGSVFVVIGLAASLASCGSSSDSRDRNVDAGFLCSQGGFCKVGDTGPAGGIVFVAGLKAGDTAWEAAPLNGFGDYNDADEMTSTLEFGGLGGWTLPSVDNLNALRDQQDLFACAPDTDCPQGFPEGNYWTAEVGEDGAKAVSFESGDVSTAALDEQNYYRPVRPIQVGTAVGAVTTIAAATTVEETTITTVAETTTVSETTTSSPPTTERATTTTASSTTAAPTTSMAPSTTAAPTTTVGAAVVVKPGSYRLATLTTSSCAITQKGAVKCWGRNEQGQNGNGRSGVDLLDEHPVQVTGLDATTAARTAVEMSGRGGYHVCALTKSGAVMCWGSRTYGQLGDGFGNGRDVSSRSTALAVAEFDGSSIAKTASFVATGETTSCAIKVSGALFCWGDNRAGQAALGDRTYSNVPVQVEGFDGTSDGRSAVMVSIGSTATCAVSKTGAVWCWGTNSSGQLGDGTRSAQSGPVKSAVIDGTSSDRQAISVSAGATNACAVISNGAVKCWGNASQGLFGSLTQSGFVLTPTTVTGIDGSTPSKQATLVSTSPNHSCALLANSSVTCWGNSGLGQAGKVGVVAPPFTPSDLDGKQDDHAGVSISVSPFHTCAILKTGNAYCLGGAGTARASTQYEPQELG